MTSTAITRRVAGVGGVTSSCGNSGGGRRGIVVQTRSVHRTCSSVFNMTASSNSSIIVPDEEDIGPTGDIHSPIEASACLTVTRKRTLRDGEGSATWDSAIKVDGSTWRYSGGTCHG